MAYGPQAMAKKFPAHPANPHRLCWGCDKYCPATSMVCGNGSERTQHPVELFGDDWQEWAEAQAGAAEPVPAEAALPALAADPSSG